MIGKYHIGLKGVPTPCKAKKFCPFGGTHEHFNTKEEALQHADEINERRINSIDLKEGEPWQMNQKKIDYDKFKKRVVEGQPLFEIERIKSHIQEELNYFDERIKEFKDIEEDLIKWKNNYQGIIDDGPLYWKRQFRNNLENYPGTDPEIYELLKVSYFQKPYDKNLEENYTKNKSIFNLFRKNKYYCEYENVFSNDVDLTKLENNDVIGTNMIIKEENTNRIIERINLSDEECKDLGIIRPNTNFLIDLGISKYEGKYKDEKRNYNSIGLNHIQKKELENLAEKKLVELEYEERDFQFLCERKKNYLKLLEDIKTEFGI